VRKRQAYQQQQQQELRERRRQQQQETQLKPHTAEATCDVKLIDTLKV
jgi:hypothetical protein